MCRQSRATTPLRELIERAAFLLTRRFKTCQTYLLRSTQVIDIERNVCDSVSQLRAEMQRKTWRTNVAVSLVAILLVVGMIVGTAIGQQAPCATADIPKPLRWPDGKSATGSLSCDDDRVCTYDDWLALPHRQ